MKEEKIAIKNKNIFKNKWQMVIYGILFITLTSLFIIIGKTDFNTDISDNERFHEDFPMVTNENIFKYIDVVDAHFISEGKDGIILFGSKGNEWTAYLADIINKVAKEVGVKKVYYYDFFEDRKNNNATYEDILNNLSDYVMINDQGKKEIYAPTLLVMLNKQVMLYDTDTNFVSGYVKPSDYYTKFNYGLKYDEIKEVFKEYMEVRSGKK